MEYLSKEKSVVLVGLNPTAQAKKHGAVFCQTNGLWRVIHRSDLFKLTGLKSIDHIELSNDKDGKYKYFASEFFRPNSKIGYLDLVPDVFEKKGNRVKVSEKHLDHFYSKMTTLNVAKIGLLGKQVTRALFPELANENFGYGKLQQSVKVGEGNAEVFCLPFPETVPMKMVDKVRFYNLLTVMFYI